MKSKKRLKFGLLGVFMLCILAGTFLAHPMKVEAATTHGWLFRTSVRPREKVGKYYFWLSDDGNKIYASTSKKGKGKAVVKVSKGRSIKDTFIFENSKLYYAEYDNSYGYIYSMNINGKGRKNLGKIKNMYIFSAYYNGNLYISGSDDGRGMHTYRLNTKTKKAKRIMKNTLPSDQYKQYLVFTPSPFENSTNKTCIYNCKTGKSVKISNQTAPYRAKFSSGRVYYAERINAKSARIMSCGLNGKNKKTVVKKLPTEAGNVIGKMTSKYVYYTKWDKSGQNAKYYRYDVKKKKSAKISESQFKY